MQKETQIATLPDGRYVVVWSGNGPGDSDGIFLRQFGADGTPIGNQIRFNGVALDTNDRLVNTFTFNKQMNPAVAMKADGSYVIVWQSQNQEYSGSQFGVFGKRFNAAGVTLDAPGQAEFQINTTTAKDQSKPSVAIDQLGRFVVVWQSKEQEGGAYGYDIYGQLYDAGGNRIGPTEFHVNTTPDFEQFNASVAMDARGDFVVAWEHYLGTSGPTDIYLQQFDFLANKIGGQRVANSSPTGNQYLPDVGMDSAGNFIIVWDGYGTADTDGGVFLRRYIMPSNGLTFSVGDGSYDSNMVFRGKLADINSALNGITFRPTAGFTGLASITVTTNDLGKTGYGGPLLDTDILNINVMGTSSPVGSVIDVNAAANQVAENSSNGSQVGITAQATDPYFGQTVSYSLDDNAGGRFTIDSLSGIVTVANGLLLDYEAITSHNITVRATSVDGSFSTALFAIALLPVNDNLPVFTSPNNPVINENQTVVQTLTATDADAPAQTITYSTTGGVDSGFFTINGFNQLVFVVAADYETPLDIDFDNIYMVEVTASDGAGGLTSMMISVKVLDVVEGNILYVDTTSDVVDGNVSSIGALLASRGIDGRISLREAILATNNTLNVGGPDIIRFAIPDNDPGHYY